MSELPALTGGIQAEIELPQIIAADAGKNFFICVSRIYSLVASSVRSHRLRSGF